MSIARKICQHLGRLSLVDQHVYTAKHGPARGLKRQGGLGWVPAFVPRLHEWEAEEAFISSLDLAGVTVYDVGGDQGLFTIFFAERVGDHGRVVVFEPNPMSCERIRRNVWLNGFRNVHVLQVGLGEQRAVMRFAFPILEPSRGTFCPDDRPTGESRRKTTWLDIGVVSLDDEIERSNLPAPDFIKLDVEGMEYMALKGMCQTLRVHHPRLSIEMHGGTVEGKKDNARRVVTLLEAFAYRIRHIESGEIIKSQNGERAFEGHLYCEAG